jgi:hypothetical protein
VYWSAELVEEVPATLVTCTSTVPVACAGTTAAIEVEELTTQFAAGVVPNITADTPAKLVPVIVIGAPPSVLPDDALKAVVTGRFKTSHQWALQNQQG